MNRHKKLATRALGIALLGATFGVTAEGANLLSSTENPATVTLDAQAAPDGSVSGTVRNGTGGTVQNVHVLVRHNWLWKNEFKPGADDPGSTATVTLDEPIAPGGSQTFSYRPSAPLPARSDGHFVTNAELGAYEVVTGG